ncbi:hypothetical protein F4801DRAFT_372971 [Xylaria longipes]|nr:hypothetical protein F4801DRAFT_372971 [Xylaria longipes]RYC62962.1 hypothetical protein CHU98_g3244 [Xylaria longipes]
MQRLGSPSIFPTLPGAGTQLWKCQTRYRHAKWWKPRKWGPRRRDTWPTFDISNLLLDLDAEGVKGVRAFDPQLDGVAESKSALRERELQPIKERVAEFEKGYQECQSSFEAISAHKLHPLHISDFDLLAATLFDSPNSPRDVNDSTTHADMLGSVLDGNGIPPTVRNDTSNTITYMLRRRQLLHGSRILSPDPGLKALFSTALSRCTTFPQIDRLVARMIHTAEGCRTLSKLSDELHTSLTRVPEGEPVQLLSLLNNLLINFDRYQLHMSSRLLNLGIWTSLKCQAIITAHQYIERTLKRGYLSKGTIDSIIETLLQNSIASTQFSSHEFQSNSTSRLTTVYSLLTGYVPGEDQRTVFLRSLVNSERVDGFRPYIQCLARLGAFRTLWHEWHATDSGSQDMNGNTKLDFGFSGNGYFVTAILEALRKNEDMKDLARSPQFANVTGQFREDCQLDLIAISKSAKILALPGKENGNQDSTPARVRQWEELYQIFKEKQIQKAFPALQAFLIRTNSFS